MRKKVKELELENETLKKMTKTHRVNTFFIGFIFGAFFTILSKNLFVADKLKQKIKSLKVKQEDELELDIDQETIEVLKKEKDNFE